MAALVLQALGLGLLILGVALVSLPAAFMVAGVLLIVATEAIARQRKG